MARFALWILLVCVSADAADAKGDPSDAKKLFTKGRLAYEKHDYDAALEHFGKCLALDPKFALAYDLRGSCYFMKGKFKESVADFDQYLKLEPKKYNDHWRRGIALYYLGKFEEGKKQFEGYEKVDTNDVENAVWHLMCAARKDNLETARKGMLKIGKDVRVPMMEVYDLFKGTRKPDEIMKVAKAGMLTEDQRKRHLFYAHLYLGLYHDLVGEKKKAIEHLELASGKLQMDYMGEVARVHLAVLKKAK